MGKRLEAIGPLGEAAVWYGSHPHGFALRVQG